MLNVDIYSNFVSLFIELFVTVRILGPGHVIDSLVWMFLLHEVVNEVPEQDGLAGDVGVMDCHLMRIMFKRLIEIFTLVDLHVGVGVSDCSMEGTVDQENSKFVWMVFGDGRSDISQLLLPALPELLGVLGAVPDGGVGGAVQQQHGGRHVRVGRGGTEVIQS